MSWPLKLYLLILLESGSGHSVHEYSRQKPLLKGTVIGCLACSSATPLKFQITLTCSHFGQHALYAPPAQNPQAAYILTNKDETIALVMILGKELSYQMPTKYLRYWPSFALPGNHYRSVTECLPLLGCQLHRNQSDSWVCRLLSCPAQKGCLGWYSLQCL